ncbi:MAG: oligosaccharide flippase family protein [Clostridiales bacterium]|jgi:stage V sporulation protein B|nr:oligosaccharide flippase family protein [Clostridiales bacterium]
MNKRVFYANAAVLTASAVVLRLSGIWFRSYICGRIGASGMGMYQLILSIFFLGITTCAAGFSVTVMRLVAEGHDTETSVRSCLAAGLSLSLIAAGGLFLASNLIAVRLIGSEAAVLPLRLLLPGLPFISAGACIRGYFLAIRNTAVPAAGELLEQAVTIGAGITLAGLTGRPLESFMLGILIGEVVSLLYITAMYRVFLRRNGGSKGKKGGVFRLIVHIAAPVLCGSFLRSLLSSTENILIPQGLKKHGADEDGSLAQYGMMQGMVMPVLCFPSAFLSALSMLLIPELAEANAAGKKELIQREAAKAFRVTLTFSFLVTSVIIVFADNIGMAFYNSTELSTALRIMAPILPLMYLDSVVDGMLKGLDQQLYSLKYNFSDSVIRVVLITLALPLFGIRAYMAILFISEIYNASLSISRLLKVTTLKVDIIGWILTPAVSSALLYYVLALVKKLCRF